MKKIKLTPNIIFFLGLTALSLFVFFKTAPVNKPITSDGIGYYLYLPSIFIEHNLNFKAYKNTGGVIPQPQGASKYINKYPVGTAVLESPFWLVGHLLNSLFGQNKENIFDPIYQTSIGMAAITYFIMGTYILKKLLSKYFEDKVVFITLVLIIFGTNLFNYAVFEGSFSHIYSFFLINLFIYLCFRFRAKLNYKKILLLGINFGLIILVRPINVFVLILPFIFFFSDFKGLIVEKKYLTTVKYLIIFTISVILTFLPQMLYWNYSTGNFLNFSYPNEAFNFLKPEIANLLFSIRKGLFFWAPILIFSIGGFWFLPEKLKLFRNVSAFYLLLIVMINSSWWYWSFGGSFGQRPFVDSIIIFALPLAGFIDYVLKRSSLITKYLFFSAIVLLCFINICLNIQYVRRVLPNDYSTLGDIIKSLKNFTLD